MFTFPKNVSEFATSLLCLAVVASFLNEYLI